MFVLVLAFLVKMSIFFFHFWIPREHVEANVSHPMILASVMLNLGGWMGIGLFRVFTICLGLVFVIVWLI